MSLKSRKFGSIESLEQRQLMAGDTLGALAPTVEPAPTMLVQVQNASGDESCAFGVEREMKESEGRHNRYQHRRRRTTGGRPQPELEAPVREAGSIRLQRRLGWRS